MNGVFFKNMRAMLVPALLLTGILGFTTTARAVEFIDNGNIPADQTIDDDVFISGQNVVIDGTVNGDLFAAGSTVTVNGLVRGSLFTSAQTIKVNGTIEGSLYAGSSSMEFGEGAMVGRNMYYGGFSLVTLPGSKVSRDLLVGAYQVQHSGEAGRDLLVGAAAIELNGKVGGDAKLDVAGPGSNGMMPFYAPPGVSTVLDPGLRVSGGAEIGGVLQYSSEVQQAGSIAADPAGGVVYQTPMPGETRSPSAPVRVELRILDWIFARLREFITLLVLGALAMWKLPVLLGRWAERVRLQVLPSAGWGMLVVILGYAGAGVIALLVLALGIFFGVVTLGGLAQTVFGVGFSSLSLVFTVFTLLVSYGSKLIVAYLLGKLVLGRLAPQYADHRVWPMVLGVVIYVALRSVPVLGWVLAVLATFAGLGAIWLVFKDERQPSLPAIG